MLEPETCPHPSKLTPFRHLQNFFERVFHDFETLSITKPRWSNPLVGGKNGRANRGRERRQMGFGSLTNTSWTTDSRKVSIPKFGRQPVFHPF